MKFFTLAAGIAAADQFINLHMAPPSDIFGLPIRDESQLMALYGHPSEIYAYLDKNGNLKPEYANLVGSFYG